MPELPEVEGFRRRLVPVAVGRSVDGLTVIDGKRWHPAAGLDADSVRGATVESIDRAGKMLLYTLSNRLVLAMHLMIAGQLVLERPNHPREIGGHPYPRPGVDLPDASTRFLVELSGGVRLWFNDQRRFGWLRLMAVDALPGFVASQGFGPCPVAPDFTIDVFASRIAARAGRAIKVALLDQTCIAGVGNIYADESLYRARVHPSRLAGALAHPELATLHLELVGILETAIPVGGALMRGNRRVDGDSVDGARDFLQAHGCAGVACPRCVARGEIDPVHAPRIIRTVVGGRGTYLCPSCQPEPSGTPDGTGRESPVVT